MPRDVRDEEAGITWSCIEAYAGLSSDNESKPAAAQQADGEPLTVVCTPSGGARSVRLELQPDWESALDDGALLQRIHHALH